MKDWVEQLHGRIAELEAEVISVRNWATSVSNELAEAIAERDDLKDKLHYCNGTCDLAMRHRDEAEAERDRLRFALEIIRAGETLDPRRAADAALSPTPSEK